MARGISPRAGFKPTAYPLRSRLITVGMGTDAGSYERAQMLGELPPGRPRSDLINLLISRNNCPRIGVFNPYTCTLARQIAAVSYTGFPKFKRVSGFHNISPQARIPSRFFVCSANFMLPTATLSVRLPSPTGVPSAYLSSLRQMVSGPKMRF